MSVRPPEISYEPYFYYPRPGLVIPELVIPEHLKGLISETRGTKRFIYEGYEPCIQDILEAHIHRASKLALALNYISADDRLDVSSYMLIHDLPEKEKKHDMTSTDKKRNPQRAALIEAQERKIADNIFTSEDRLRFWRYETAKPLLNGANPAEIEVIPNAILSKIVDVFENDTYHHTWVQYLQSLYGEQIYAMLPADDFTFSLPRYRILRQNIVNLDLPEAHLQLSIELLDEAEAFARASLQVEA